MFRNFCLILIITILFLGCGTAHTVEQRYFPDEKDAAFQNMLSTLQELGWTVKTTDKEAGLITAEKAGRRKRRPEVEASITISPRDDGSNIKISVSKAGRGGRIKVRQEAEEIMKHYSELR